MIPTEDGLERIGLSGGYIKIPESTNSDPRAYLSSFAGGFKIPYWWHDGLNAVPTEEFIVQELRNHVKSELKSCINKFETFSGRFEINELKEPAVDVQLNDNDVSVTLKYPIEVVSKNGNLKQLIQNFGYTIPIRFKKVYELAKLIMERENADYFLEQRTIDLYSMDESIPTTDVEATCTPKVWQLSAIQEKLKALLRVNLPYIRIKGTEYNPSLYVPNPDGRSTYAGSYYQQHYIWEIDKDSEKKYNNMKVAFSYENWPMQIHATPSENGILRSNAEKGTQMLSFLCINLWHFTYDINYPVLVTIFDQETATNRAYQFSFPFKVSVVHNQPGRINTGAALFETTIDLLSDDYCSEVQNELTIFTVNNATGEDMRDVNLTFVCGRFYCNMGQSNWLSLGAAAGITKRFPYCVNGIIKGAKQGFADAQSFIQTHVDGPSYFLCLNPIKEFKNYRVVKHMLSNPSIAYELDPNEKASILIKGKSAGFQSFAAYPKEEGYSISLSDGRDETYEVNIFVVKDESIVGGYVGDWKVSKEGLKGAGEIVFHVIWQGAASEDENALFVSGLSSYSKNVPFPELK